MYLYLVTRSLTHRNRPGKAGGETEPALNALFAITFSGRFPAAETG